MTDQGAVNQRNTVDLPSYTLGSKASIMLETGVGRSIISLTLVGADTVITLGSALPALNSGGNLFFRVSGCDNGALSTDNSIINGQHTVSISADINPALTQITLRGKVLSSYVTPQFITTARAAYQLGLYSQVVIVKNQVSLDMQFTCLQHNQTRHIPATREYTEKPWGW
jgi:hypothetical protein